MKLSKENCKNEILDFFNITNAIFVTKTTKSSIEFKEKYTEFRYNRGRAYTQKGKITLEGDGDTNIIINYNKNIMYTYSSVLIPIIVFFLYILRSTQIIFILIFLGFFVITISSFIVIFNYNINKDEEVFAEFIFSYLSDVSRIYETYSTDLKTFSCPNCGYENLSNSEECSHCLARFPRCFICRRLIISKDVVFCPLCNAPFHKSEFLEWLKVKAHCKICKKELDIWEFQKYLDQHEQLDEIYSIKCPECKKLISPDSNFCIFCGVKILDNK